MRIILWGLLFLFALAAVYAISTLAFEQFPQWAGGPIFFE